MYDSESNDEVDDEPESTDDMEDECTPDAQKALEIPGFHVFKNGIAAKMRYEENESKEESMQASALFNDLRTNNFLASVALANGKNMGTKDINKDLFQTLNFPYASTLDQIALKAIKSTKCGEVILRDRMEQRAFDEFNRRVAQKRENNLDPASIKESEITRLFPGGVSNARKPPQNSAPLTVSLLLINRMTKQAVSTTTPQSFF